MALGYAAIALVVLAIFLPVAMVYKQRTTSSKTGYKVKSGNVGLGIAAICGITIIAAQFMPTKFFALRADCRCSSRLTTSLPVPVSPCIKTGASELAHSAINLISLIASSLLPMNVVWAVNRFTEFVSIKRRTY